MNLEAQIEMITAPQDFTRLCNAVLIAEHGPDFLPIDDDRADRGNDGYLKTQKRLYAAHCFKRIQNKSLDMEIQAKMLGDLRKAITLRDSGAWDISCWTFLSNYPIPEKIAARIVAVGQQANIDVSWLGPTYFASVLHRYSEVRSLFPSLMTNEVLQNLDKIRQMLARLSEPTYDKPINRIPENPQEQRALILQAPPAWEYLLYAGVLLQGKRNLEHKWRDFRSGYSRRNGTHFTTEAAIAYLEAINEAAIKIVDGLMLVFHEEEQTKAFGAPGEPGDPEEIERISQRVITTYEDLIDWANEIRASVYPPVFRTAAERAAEMAIRPCEDIRAFIDLAVKSIGGLPQALAERDGNSPVVLDLSLVLTIDEQAAASFWREKKNAIRRAKRLNR